MQNLNVEFRAVQEQLRARAEERAVLIQAMDDVLSRPEYKIGHALRRSLGKRQS